jgi:hypothetical protein
MTSKKHARWLMEITLKGVDAMNTNSRRSLLHFGDEALLKA